MRIKLASIMVDNQDRALKFYTEIFGFVKKHDIPVGGGLRWITVVSPEAVDGAELSLEPNANPAAKTRQCSRREFHWPPLKSPTSKRNLSV